MNKKILFSLFVIGIVASLAIAGTFAYFSAATEVTGNEFNTADMSISAVAGLPIIIEDLYPGAIRSKYIEINYTTDGVPADIYFGAQHVPGGANLTNALEVRVLAGDNATTIINWQDAINLFTTWQLLQNNATNGNYGYYVEFRLKETGVEQNELQDVESYADVVLYAIQDGQTPSGMPNDYVVAP